MPRLKYPQALLDIDIVPRDFFPAILADNATFLATFGRHPEPTVCMPRRHRTLIALLGRIAKLENITKSPWSWDAEELGLRRTCSMSYAIDTPMGFKINADAQDRQVYRWYDAEDVAVLDTELRIKGNVPYADLFYCRTKWIVRPIRGNNREPVASKVGLSVQVEFTEETVFEEQIVQGARQGARLIFYKNFPKVLRHCSEQYMLGQDPTCFSSPPAGAVAASPGVHPCVPCSSRGCRHSMPCRVSPCACCRDPRVGPLAAELGDVSRGDHRAGSLGAAGPGGAQALGRIVRPSFPRQGDPRAAGPR